MLIAILGSILAIFILIFIVIVRNGGRHKEDEAEDIPGYDYGEPPYNYYKHL